MSVFFHRIVRFFSGVETVNLVPSHKDLEMWGYFTIEEIEQLLECKKAMRS